MEKRLVSNKLQVNPVNNLRPVTPKISKGQKIGLFLGPLLFLAIMLFFPAEGLSKEGIGVLATTVWIATWWITESVPIPITSLMPILLFPMLGVTKASEVTISYADSIIFLFIGGFMLAIAIEKWNLHRRIAMTITMIAIFAAFLLFLIPAKNSDETRILVWKDAEKIPWGILLLFGGGSALGKGFQTSGLAQWIGEQMTFLGGFHFSIVVITVVLLVIILSEFTSNVTTSIMLLPIMGALASAIDVHPYMLLFAASVATSCAFMLPTAATPNTIMFATGQIPVKVMIRTGFWLNLFCLIIIMLMIIYFMPFVYGIDISVFPESLK